MLDVDVNMKKKFLLVLITIFLILSSQQIYAEEDGLYFSSEMIKDATFTWEVVQSIDFYENIPQGALFTVTLEDDLYPGPLSEVEYEQTSTIMKVDGEEYTGEGFPLIWYLYTIELGMKTTIRESFESYPSSYNVTDGSIGSFNVDFEIREAPYNLYVEMEIGLSSGLTTRYYEHFFSDNSLDDSTIELKWIKNPERTTVNILNTLIILPLLSIFYAILKKRKFVGMKI